MSIQSSGREPVEKLAEEFAERFRRGERPSLTEYTQKYPELAEQIRDLFPALAVIEQFGSVAGPAEVTSERATGRRAALPQQLGEYRLLREVGRGGMGVVYEAVQESLGRHVALKVLPSYHLLNPTHLERFRREARAAAQLHHTNIVPVFGVGEWEGIHYYAMQFIQGQGLDAVLEDVKRLRGEKREPESPQATRALSASIAQGLLSGRLEVAEIVVGHDSDRDGERSCHDGNRDPRPEVEPGAPATSTVSGVHRLTRDGHSELASQIETQYCRSVAQVGVQVAEALAFAHKQGILHRDIKPSNLLLDTRGTVWITDFGLAKAEGSDDLTNTGDIVGTVRFMAPERFQGKADPRSDVYSTGITLYEMLTLRPAFADSHRAQLIECVMNQDPPPPRKLDPHIARDLETIVLKAIAKDPADRYSTAEALAEDLRRFLADRPIRARRTSLAERTWRLCRRNPVVASLLAAVGVLLATVAIVSTLSAVQLKISLEDTQKAERKARLGEADALVGEAHGTRYSRRPGQRFETLAALGKAAAIGRELGQPTEWFDRLRNEAIAALALSDIHITRSWDGFPPGTHWAELSHDFELYARTTKQGDCSVRRVADDFEIAHLPQLGEPALAVFGPGRLLVLFGEASKRCQLWDLAGREPVLRINLEHAEHWDFRPDGCLFILSHRNGSAEVYATKTGVCEHRLTPNGLSVLSLHPTEPVVATCSYGSPLIQVRDLRTGTALVSLELPWKQRGSWMCAWSPDGRILAVSEGDGGLVHLYAFDPAHPDLRLTRVLRGDGNGGTAVLFNPAGDRLATRGWDSRVHLFDVHTGRLLFSTPSKVSTGGEQLCFDPTGKRLAAARAGPQLEQIGLWSVADGREHRALVHDSAAGSPHYSPAVHPGGRVLARGVTDGLALFDLETGGKLDFVKVVEGVCSVCFDGAGNLLTNGLAGFFRWPVRVHPSEPGRLTIGPPERLAFHPGKSPMAASRNGQVIAQPISGHYNEGPYRGGWILHPSAPQARRVDADARMSWASVSPDGRWVAFGIKGMRVNVYEAATGRRVWQSPDDGNDYCRFSPDGRWLVTANDGGRAYRVGTWEPGLQLGAGVPWDVSPDSRLVVLGLAEGVYRLVELATGRELARLEDPEQFCGNVVFTPDGTRLVVTAKDGLRIWDLRRIREELVNLGLEGDLPLREPVKDGNTAKPLEVEVDLGNAVHLLTADDPTSIGLNSFLLALNPFNPEVYLQRGLAYERRNQVPKAIADYSLFLALAPAEDKRRAEVKLNLDDLAISLEHYSRRCHELARPLVTGPETERDPAQALRLAQKAVELMPAKWSYLNTLGVAYYRLGRYEQAIEVLERSLQESRVEAAAQDLFFLAMSHACRGDAPKARDCFERAVQWVQERQGKLGKSSVEELAAFRVEAEAELAKFSKR